MLLTPAVGGVLPIDTSSGRRFCFFLFPSGSSVKFTRSNCCGWNAVAVIFKVVTTLEKKITEP